MSLSPIDNVAQSAAPVLRDLMRLRETVGQVVGSVFYGTLLKTMRESELKGEFGHGGRGEEAFAPQLHGLLAERMGTANRDGVSEVLYRSLEKQQSLISAQRAQR